MTDFFLQAVQGRTARVAVGASTARGQGAEGVVQAARRLMDVLPRPAWSWGLARKHLNIFLRAADFSTAITSGLYAYLLAEPAPLKHPIRPRKRVKPGWFEPFQE